VVSKIRASMRPLEPIQLRRVVHQNAVSGRRIRHPPDQEVHQERIVRLDLLRRMRPIAPPHQALGSSLDVALHDRDRIRVGGGPTLVS